MFFRILVAAFAHRVMRTKVLSTTFDCLDDIAFFLTGAHDRRNDAMSHSDWRSTAAYDRPGFAWEYVRRNPAYRRDCRELAHLKPESSVTTAFRRRWGLCFCD